ncbi:MAG: nucleotidyltransferase family protein [Planctomycetales bacterium]|nr:nucleotidyltransferase family protein [Planctomycetales bacterium]
MQENVVPIAGADVVQRPPSYAIVPAAGHSVRMGQPKLTLPWRGRPLLEQVLGAWTDSQVDAVVVVARRDDTAIADIARRAGVMLVQPDTDPPDMKASVRCALERIRQDFSPADEDRWLLAPADMPLLSPRAIDAVRQACGARGVGAEAAIVVPTYHGRRGHPAAFRWSLAAAVDQLSDAEGLNRLLAEHPVCELPLDYGEVLIDVDTPDDYEQLTRRDQSP